MDDASLVEAARSGDGSAWAAIYDRYADKLHDHCHRILRDRDEAADALHDAFIAASRNLEQLRDPTRLRPWLYSICRHEALRRARKRSRVELTDDLGEMVSVDEDLGRGARAEELQELVWSAAAGLNERDQALLDLNLRQGLEGQDLADAMGTSLNNSYVMLSRLRDQVERSLGALLIARLGREDCEELDALLQGWDGRFSPLLRKRVARHVDGCEICSERRAAVVSPLALLAAAPLVPAPRDLRDRVLSALDTGGAVPISFTRAGFAGPSPGTERRPAPAWVLGAVACIVLLVAGLLVVQVGGDDATELTASGGTTTTADGEPGTSPAQGATTTTTGTDGPSTTSPDVAPPPTDAAGPPSTDGTSIAPPPTTPPPPPTDGTSIVPPPPATTIPPTTTAPPTTTTTAPPTTTTSTTTTTPADTTAPTIGAVSQSASAINTQSCDGGLPKSVTITASITDASAVTAVLQWSGPSSGAVAMSRSGTAFTGSFGNFTTGGTANWVVLATDAAGNQSTTEGTVAVNPCPQ
jgi:RNA polymerase sigma factor (sigma-70 family)